MILCSRARCARAPRQQWTWTRRKITPAAEMWMHEGTRDGIRPRCCGALEGCPFLRLRSRLIIYKIAFSSVACEREKSVDPNPGPPPSLARAGSGARLGDGARVLKRKLLCVCRHIRAHAHAHAHAHTPTPNDTQTSSSRPPALQCPATGPSRYDQVAREQRAWAALVITHLQGQDVGCLEQWPHPREAHRSLHAAGVKDRVILWRYVLCLPEARSLG